MTGPLLFAAMCGAVVGLAIVVMGIVFICLVIVGPGREDEDRL